LANEPDELVVLDGSTFFVSDGRGDSRPDCVQGFFFADVRHLSEWVLLVDDEPVRPLTARNVDYYSTRIYATLGSARVGENPPVSIRRTGSWPTARARRRRD
jgi:hypothetical protein